MPGRVTPHRSGRTLQPLVTLRVIAAALLNPLQAAVGVGRLVGVVLVDAGVHARLAGRLLGVFRIDCVREDRISDRQYGRSRGCSFLLRGSGGRGYGGGIGTALRLAEIV